MADGMENMLALDIIQTISQMFEQPEVFASNAASFEEQFFTLYVLVAPYVSQGLTGIEAAQKLADYIKVVLDTKEDVRFCDIPTDFNVVVKALFIFYKNEFKDIVGLDEALMN